MDSGVCVCEVGECGGAVGELVIYEKGLCWLGKRGP